MEKLKNGIVKGENTLNYKVEIQKNVFFSVLFVDKNNSPLENNVIKSEELIHILDCIALLFKTNIKISIGVTLDFEIDSLRVTDIYMTFKNDKLDIQYSLH